MLLKNNLLEDPLKEKALPLFAKKLNINHFSPTQFSIPDGNWLFKYLVLTQEERRALPSNSQMKAGVAVNNVLQKHLADTIWKFGPQRKLTPMANQEKNKDKQEMKEHLQREKMAEQQRRKVEEELRVMTDKLTKQIRDMELAQRKTKLDLFHKERQVLSKLNPFKTGTND